MITQEELKELFTYCDETGNILRKVRTNQRNKVGDIAGTKLNGYITIGVNGNPYKAHRLIWIMEYGSIDSKLQIDHVNGIRDDNRLVNLRLVTPSVNNQNRARPNHNKSGVIGVAWYEPLSKWSAKITVNKDRKHLGYFVDIKNAIKARQAAEIECGFHENHGRD